MSQEVSKWLVSGLLLFLMETLLGNPVDDTASLPRYRRRSSETRCDLVDLGVQTGSTMFAPTVTMDNIGTLKIAI